MPKRKRTTPAFAAALAALADLYVNDAFGAAHRAHASVEGDHASSAARAAGLLMEQELRYLGHALESPERPFVAILGGAKVSDKIEVIENLLGKVDRLLIGGAMAYTFFKSRGVPVGDRSSKTTSSRRARTIEADARQRGVSLELPVDHVVTDKIEAGRGRTRSWRSATRRSATGWASTSVRRRSRPIETLDRRREDRRLERTDGRLRNRRVRGRHQRGGARGRGR